MRNSFLAISIIAIITVVAVADHISGNTKEPAEQVILKLETDQVEAFLRGDVSTLERLWADEFMFTAPNGMVVNKNGYLSMLKLGELKYEVWKLEEIKVRVYGEAAVVTGRVTAKGQVWDHVIDGQDRYTTAYVKQNGRWMAVATHASRISPMTGR
jgi:hypothetical protein